MKFLPFLLILGAILGCAAPRQAPPEASKPTGPELQASEIKFEETSDVHLTAHGQITNISNRTLEYIKATLTIYDDKGEFQKSEYTYLDVHTLGPGQRSNFSLIMEKPLGKWRYELSLTDREGFVQFKQSPQK